jgi:hypothetical protein
MAKGFRGLPVIGAIWAAALAVGLLPGAAAASPGLLLSSVEPADSDRLTAGQQLLVEGQQGETVFAGVPVALDGFTGILGYSSELAYVLVIEGEARAGNRAAGPGRMLLIPPYGGPVGNQRFDAARFAGSWSDPLRAARPQAYAALESVAARQQSGLFLGRLGRTRFNVAVPGTRRGELGRRALLGSETVRAIRFSGNGDAAAIERQVVETFAAGLRSGDPERVAALMDPSPFGGRRLAGGAAEARLVAARGLIASRDWNALFGSGPARLESGTWRLGAAAVTLRRIDDFVFIQRIEGEAP